MLSGHANAKYSKSDIDETIKEYEHIWSNSRQSITNSLLAELASEGLDREAFMKNISKLNVHA